MVAKTRGARVRAAAAEAVDAVVAHGRSLDTALADAEQKTPPDDRSLLRMLCFGTLRQHWQIQFWIDTLLDRPLKKRDSVVRALLAVGLYQLVDTRIPDHAAVSQTVEAARLLRRPKHAGLLNAILRRFGRDDIATKDLPDESTRFNHPHWLIDALKNDWPDDWQAVLEANNLRAPMALRVNTARISGGDYRAMLAAAKMAASDVTGIGDTVGLCLEQAVPVSELPGFEEGQVSVQDGAAQLAAPWLLADGMSRVLDACAAPGGKSAHLKELGREHIELVCVDKDPERLVRATENLARLGLNATVIAGDASQPLDWWDGQAFDGILLDAPCSATGVIRRHPDVKLLRRASDIEALAGVQMSILTALWPMLAPAGRLLYVTCSVLQQENERVVGRFLESTPDAWENDMLQNNNIRDLMRKKACGYQVLPGTNGMDGFYFACLEKVS